MKMYKKYGKKVNTVKYHQKGEKEKRNRGIGNRKMGLGGRDFYSMEFSVETLGENLPKSKNKFFHLYKFNNDILSPFCFVL